jgi:hypothetical protein
MYKEIQNGAVAKSYMANGLLILYMVNICAFPHKLGSSSSYTRMTLQLLHSKFPYTVYEENFILFVISVQYLYT